ncbi:GroES-like protein [Biscogniauxia sp. FL1348]|nr:GroES-like protein [Biscogniauxia sp. FL1348]
MPSFTVFKGSESGEPIRATTTRPDELSGDQVFLKVIASGLCGTDLHYRNIDMGLGHEGIAIVEATGPDCKRLKKGDRVGWGLMQESCGHCMNCLTGRDTHCVERAIYGHDNLDQGSFATHGVWREPFLFKIPESMTDEAAAPLQCGGATVFNALADYGVKPSETVGVMGVGGLGHLAIQFASKMGCRVIVLSSSDSKREEAMRFGAHEFISTKGKKELDVSRPLDRLLVTTSSPPNWGQIIPIMAHGGYIIPLTIDAGNFEIPYMPLIMKGLTIQGSVVAAKSVHRRMLDFAALHKIEPVVETFPLSEEGIKEAMDKLGRGKMHFRAVLKPVA